METNKTSTKESKFYLAKTINEAKEVFETRIKTYNEKYVKKQLESGQEFFTELKTDPVKTVDDLIYNSNESFKKAKSTGMETLKRKADTAKKDVRERIEKINQKTRPLYKGIENDAKLIVEDFIELGKKNLESLPIKKTIEKKFSASVDSIPSKLNLPSKEEIDNLVIGLDAINKKVDALGKQHAGV